MRMHRGGRAWPVSLQSDFPLNTVNSLVRLPRCVQHEQLAWFIPLNGLLFSASPCERLWLTTWSARAGVIELWGQSQSLPSILRGAFVTGEGA